MGIQVSFSACERYLLSPFSYFAHYFLRLRPTQISSALFFGAAVDEGLNSLLQDKKENKPIDVIKAKSIFKTALMSTTINGEVLDHRIKGIIKFSKADLDESLIKDEVIPETHDPAWYSLLAKGNIIIDAYLDQVLSRIKKVHVVQHSIELTNNTGDTFTGIIDLIATLTDDKIYLLDNKTTSKKYEDNSVEESSQLATYFEAVKDEFKLDGAGYIAIPKVIRKKKEPRCEIQVILGETKEELIAQTFIKYDQVLDGIKNGKFECSRECQKAFWGCAYSDFCESGGKNTTGLAYLGKRK